VVKRLFSVGISLVVLLLTVGIGTAVAQDSKPPGVLIINSYDENLPWWAEFNKGLLAQRAAIGPPATLYYEHMDAARLGTDPKGFTRTVESKFGDAGIDVIVADEKAAVDWLRANPDVLPDAERISVATVAIPDSDTEAVTLSATEDVPGAVREMLQVADPQRVVVVGDTTWNGSQPKLDGVRTTMEQEAPDVPVEYLLDAPMDQVYDRLNSLPEGTAVFYLPILKDGTGTAQVPAKALEQMAATSNAPIFSAWSTFHGHGMTGGYVMSAKQVGEKTWDAVAAVLRGETPPTLNTDDAFAHLYDWRELNKHGLTTAALPAGAVVEFYQPTFWEQYWPAIVITIVVVIALAVLAILLAITNRRLDRQRDTLETTVEERTSDLAERTADLTRANQDLEQFAYVTSHDLRAPLRTIKGFATVLASDLENENISDDARDSLQEITGGVTHMQTLITALLEYSRLGGDFHPETRTVQDTVEAALRQVQADLEASHASVTTTIPEDLTWNVDDAFITSGLVNIIQNAIKYRSEDRPLRVVITAAQTDGMITLAITDNGTGIDPDQLDRATQMFQRLTTDHDGLGIGLASVQRIVQRNNGTLKLDSDGHTYTTVTINIPHAQ